MNVFKSILVPLDGTTLADRILGHVRRLLVREDAEVLLLRVMPEHAVELGSGWSAEGMTRYDARESRLHESGGVLRYRTCCWQARLQYVYRAQAPGLKVDHDIHVMFEFLLQPRRG